MANGCCSEGGIKLLYPCSGAADVGELTDRAVRKLWKEGFATKTCLAGVGADIPGFVQSAKGADVNITVDGCPMACARKCLERIGVTPVSIMLGDLGYKKGESPVTEETINSIAAAVKEASSTSQNKKTGAVTSGGGCCS
ncbi:MAG TPA: putative zinc-binding protein [Spirochaetota bacterium]|nr:putative zinc-binding protein [Spirochaetota bacterium]HPV40128.1 putative zinc-binding protein [Spirochaetota bacterium]